MNTDKSIRNTVDINTKSQAVPLWLVPMSKVLASGDIFQCFEELRWSYTTSWNKNFVNAYYLTLTPTLFQ